MITMKRIAALVLSIALVCSFAMPAFAEDSKNGSVAGYSGPLPGYSDQTQDASHGFIDDKTKQPVTKVTIKEDSNYEVRIKPVIGSSQVTIDPSKATTSADGLSFEAVGGSEPYKVLRIKAKFSPADGKPIKVGYVDPANGVTSTIPLEVTVESIKRSFGQFMRRNSEGVTPDTTLVTEVTLDSQDPDKGKLDFALYAVDNLKSTSKDFDKNKVDEEFTISDSNVLKLEVINIPKGSDKGNAIRITPKKNGTATITHKATGCTLTVTLTNVPVPSTVETGFAWLSIDGKLGGFGNRVVDTKDHGTWHNQYYSFATVDKRDTPNDAKDDIVNLFYPDDLTYKIVKNENGKEVEGNYDDTIKVGIDPQTKLHVISMNPQGTPGEYRVLFESKSTVLTDNNRYSKLNTSYFVYELIEVTESIIKVADGESIQAAIDKVGTAGNPPESDDRNITFIHLAPNGHYTEDIVVDKKVFITTEGQKDLATLTGTVTFEAEEHRGDNKEANAQIGDIILKSATKGEGTGVIVADGKFGAVSRIEIMDFAVGVEKNGPNATIGANFTNCTVGLRINMKGQTGYNHNVTARTFKNNGTAIEVIGEAGTSNGTALLVTNCNFIDNDINIANNGVRDSYVLYAAFNYYGYGTGFDYDASLGSKFKNVDQISPYYRTAVEFKGTQPFPPATAYVYSGDFKGFAINKEMADKPLDTQNFSGSVNIDIANIGNGFEKTAGWSFESTDKSKAATFNPAIATELKASSDSAVGTLPGTAKYQPVSFAHSGALPGQANVSVVKDAEAPTTGLKLYKVVGNTLVLQPEAVTFANGAYSFLRDGASDYIITDADVTVAPPSTGSDSSSSSGSSGSNDYTGSNEINNKLETTTGDKVSISVAGKPYVAASSFDVLKKNPEKTLTFKGDGYSWSFKGSDVTGNITGLMYLNTEISNKSPNAEEIKKATGDAEIINIYFGYHGQLPGKATIEMSVDSKYEGKTLNLYYYNPTTKKLETVATGLVVKNGKVNFGLTHCSDYILSPVALNATAATTAPVINNPETGAIDRIPMATAVAVLSCISVSALLYTKKSR